MIHEANHVRPNLDGIKVGGHQASSASVVSILTALYFRWLRAGDLVAIKPHASPAYHALQYLLGNLDASMLTRLREFGGLQSYPSRTKDPDPVDFSTGSVGLGAVAPMFAALADRYLRLHFRDTIASQPERRFVALVGDAELDEGNVWEAVLEEGLGELGNVTMIVDLNRQSLDRVMPGIRIRRVGGHVRGGRLARAGGEVRPPAPGRFALPGGEALRERIDEMENEEYQSLIRRPGAGAARTARRRSAAAPARRPGPATSRDVPDDDLPALLGDLGGHDQVELSGPSAPPTPSATARPSSSPTPSRAGGCRSRATASTTRRCSAPTQVEHARARPRRRPRRRLGRVRGGSPEGRLAARRRRRARLRHAATRDRPVGRAGIAIPDIRIAAATSTQQAFGDTLAALARDPEIGGAHRDRRPGRRGLDQPRRLDQPGRRLFARGRPRSPRRQAAAALGARARPVGTSSSASAR